MRNFAKDFLLFLSVLLVAFLLVVAGSVMSLVGHHEGEKVKKPSLLVLQLEGIILDSEEFVENLRRYVKEKNIKGVLVRVNSPGGVVSPSQELYRELKRVREEFQKPVVVSCGSLAASGAYYAAVAADQIVVNPGSALGSIGVIMEFANMEKLYSWAKIERFSLKTGAFKDSGSEYRPMRPDEREYFQGVLNEIYSQFKEAVSKGRKLTPAVVEKYSDGRIFTGQAAVQMGFADQIGTYNDSIRIAGELAGLGDEPELFEPPKKRRDFWEYLNEVEGVFKGQSPFKGVEALRLLGRPLFLMPGFHWAGD